MLQPTHQDVLEYARLRSRFCYGLGDYEIDQALFPSPPGSLYDPVDVCNTDAEADAGVYERIARLFRNPDVSVVLSYVLIVSVLIDIYLNRDY